MHQYLFYIGDFPIRMYGLVLCMAIFLAKGMAIRAVANTAGNILLYVFIF